MLLFHFTASRRLESLPWVRFHILVDMQNAPASRLSSWQAMGQPSSELGISPRFTLSAMFESFSFCYPQSVSGTDVLLH